jgi:putative membrane protein
LWDVKGSMVREILGRVLSCVLWSALVVLAAQIFPVIAIPLTIHSLVGVALGLLLVFRTNASYDRFWEARKLWGALINVTRQLARQARTYLVDDPALRDEVLGWTAAFGHALRHRLQGTPPALGPAGNLLNAEATAAVLASPLPVFAVVERLGSCLARARETGLVTDQLHLGLEQELGHLLDILGGCERIHNTPLPFAYVVHLRRAVILYCFTLPFALVKDFGWVTVLDTLAVAYIFFGIEELGVEIEDPFGRDDNDLPLEQYCGVVDRDVLGGSAVD